MPSDSVDGALLEADARRLHPLTVLFSTGAIARSFVLPAVVGGVSAADGDWVRGITWVVALLAIPAVAYSIASYLSFRYLLRGDELVIRSGALRRQHRVIPLARVQNTELRQSAIQRLFGVIELRVETAGGSGAAEASLSVLSVRDGERLRSEILARRSVPAGAAHEGESVQAPPATLLSRLDTRDLVLAGATSNEAGLVLAALAGVLGVLDDLPIPLPAWVADPSDLLPELSAVGLAAVIAGGLAALFLLGRLVSIAGAVIGYHAFTLERMGDELRKRYGLLSRREAHIPLRRVQAVRVEESALRRRFGLAALKIETAGAFAGERQLGGAEAFLPIARIEAVPRLLREVFADLDYASARFERVHPRSLRRAFTKYLIVLLLATGLLAVLIDPAWLLLLVATPLLYMLASWQYAHRGYARMPGFVMARSGALRRVTWIIPEHKLQTLHVTETPFQRRHGLATLELDTASGQRAASVVDLGLEGATVLLVALAEAALARRPAPAPEVSA